MAEYRERSGLFKFFYIILRVITFPLFVAIYVLKHPLWVLFLLFLAFCMAVYYPLADGKKLAEVPEWYKNKYTEVRTEVVKKAAEDGKIGLISQSLQDELELEAVENSRPKSENYNKKIMREDKIEAKTSDLKKRGGFKKKNALSSGDSMENADKEDVLNQSEGVVGGLADVLKGYRVDNTEVSVENKAVVESENVEKEAVAPLESEQMPDLLPPETQDDSKVTAPVEENAGDDELDLF